MTEDMIEKRMVILFPCNCLLHLFDIQCRDSGNGRVTIKNTKLGGQVFDQINLDGSTTSKNVILQWSLK